MAKSHTIRNTGLTIESRSNLRSGGTAASDKEFRQLKGLEIVTDFLTKAGFDLTVRDYHLTILSKFIRTAPFALISGVTVDHSEAGVRFRVKPQAPFTANSDHTTFVVRLAVQRGAVPTPGAVAVRLKAAARRLYGDEGNDEAIDAADETLAKLASPADPDQTMAAVKAVIEMCFSSSDRAVWAKAVAGEIGPNELSAKWDASLRALETAGRLVWGDAGYALPPAKLPPTATVTEPAELPPFPVITRIAPFQPEPVPTPTPTPVPTAPTPTAATPAEDPHALVDELLGLVARLGELPKACNAASGRLDEAGWDVRNAAQKVDRLRADIARRQAEIAKLNEDLAAAVAGHTQAQEKYNTAKAARSEAILAIDPELLVTMAARVEAARGQVKRPTSPETST